MSSDSNDPTPNEALPPMVIPVRRPPRPPSDRRREPSGNGLGRFVLVLLLLGSVGLNFLLCLGLGMFRLPSTSSDDGSSILEKHYSGSTTARDKVAVIRIESVLVDEMMGHVQRQIDKAAKDADVKAVVVRIVTPGGTITASDDLHKRLTELRDGTSVRYTSSPKPLVASMGAMAASGGYYIAMPTRFIYAEKTTITGSIGVYSSFINVHELAKNNGVKMELVKAGDVKAAGSPFHELKPEERQMWQDMVDNAYAQFQRVVEEGRPHLKGKLLKDVDRVDAAGNRLPDVIAVRDEKGEPIAGRTVPFKRKIADGGIFIAPEAKRLQLVDEIGYLEDATKKAATLAGLSDYKVVVYDRPVTLLSLLGIGMKQSGSSEFTKLASAAGPRIWYLAPQSEFAGMMALMDKE